ncbi:STAS domain-containing protein [Candidatus Poribacteria bacterium]|nr:STAS domain-containing protein [Candidatus Poribacteria bacterium]MYH81543.1 STAS domain-containing protein [Candidatus Poribacteria bacterium]
MVKERFMQVNIQNKNFTLLEIQGKVIGQDALVLKTMLEEHIQELEAQGGIPTLIVDMSKALTMDSAGLGVLITTSTQIRQNGGQTMLVNVNKGIKRMMIRTNLTSLFDFPKNLTEAITSAL